MPIAVDGREQPDATEHNGDARDRRKDGAGQSYKHENGSEDVQCDGHYEFVMLYRLAREPIVNKEGHIGGRRGEARRNDVCRADA
jgi:hypothetical protein